MIRVTGLYQWQDGAHFDHEYYNAEHMRLTRDTLATHGLLRLESDRYLSSAAPVPGQIVAASNAYFPTLDVAQTAMAKVGKILMADLPNYTNLKPQIHLSVVTSHA